MGGLGAVVRVAAMGGVGAVMVHRIEQSVNTLDINIRTAGCRQGNGQRRLSGAAAMAVAAAQKRAASAAGAADPSAGTSGETAALALGAPPAAALSAAAAHTVRPLCLTNSTAHRISIEKKRSSRHIYVNIAPGLQAICARQKTGQSVPKVNPHSCLNCASPFFFPSALLATLTCTAKRS